MTTGNYEWVHLSSGWQDSMGNKVEACKTTVFLCEHFEFLYILLLQILTSPFPTKCVKNNVVFIDYWSSVLVLWDILSLFALLWQTVDATINHHLHLSPGGPNTQTHILLMYCIYIAYTPTSKQFSDCSPTHTNISLDQEFGSTLKWGQTTGELASLHKLTPFLDTFLEQEPQNIDIKMYEQMCGY